MTSVVPVQNVSVNPAYGKAAYLVGVSSEARMMAVVVQRMRKSGKSLDEIKSYLRQAGLKRLFDDFKKVKEQNPVMPPPPPVRALYGRFAKGSSVFDIGTGNGSKILKFTGSLRITANDVVDILPRGLCSFKLGPVENFFDIMNEYLITSFMTFSQLDPKTQRKLVDFDGMHLVPSHCELLEAGVATYHGDKIRVVTPSCSFDDHPIVVPMHNLDYGYGIIQCYTERSITIDCNFTRKTGETQRIIIDAKPISYYDVNMDDISCKIDGIPFEIENYNGVLTVTGRNGIIYRGVTDTDLGFCLHVERTTDAFYLIRVVYYNDMVPYHTLNMLRHFTSRVKMKICGLPLLAPPDWKNDYAVPKWNRKLHSGAGVDGLITRINGSDFYVKFEWSFDFRPPDVTRFIDAAKDEGMLVCCDRVNAGLCEYVARKDGANISLTLLKERLDKTESTKVSSAIHTVTNFTIPESESLEKNKKKKN